ncbi:MAG: hypothetical protein V5B30_14165 [Candidatus Accumulibacter delftensis]
MVTVNSTLGFLSLGMGCPTVTLSDPIYNLPGLTFQGPLDDFWHNDGKPEANCSAVSQYGDPYHAGQWRLLLPGRHPHGGRQLPPLLEPERSPLDELL